MVLARTHRSSLSGFWFTVLSGTLALVLLVGAFAQHAFEVAPNHDNVWLLISARRLIDGGHYFTDIFELNPPLYIVLISPALFIADTLGIDSYDGFLVWVLGLIGGSTLLAYRWLAALAAPTPRLTPLLVAVFVATLAWAPNYAFGQREHISVILVFPYIAWLFGRARAAPIGMDAGVLAILALAAIGVFIKPHFLVVPVALITAEVIRHRQWDQLLKIHGLAFGLVGCIYAIAVAAFFPAWFDVAAIALHVYDAFDAEIGRILYAGGLYFLPMTMIWIAAETLIGTEKARAVGRVSIVAAAAFLLAVVLQRKGFPYHYLPVQSLNFLAFGFILVLAGPEAREAIGRLKSLPRYGSKQLMAGLVMLSLALSMTLQLKLVLILHKSRADIEASRLYVNLSELAKDGSVTVMSVGYGPLSVVSMLDLEWASRLGGHWMVPGIVKLDRDNREDAAGLVDLKRLARRLVTEDLERYSPPLVAVYSGPHHTLPPGFDLLSFYDSDPAFAAQWASYRQVRQDGYWRFYTRDAKPG